MIVIKNTLSSIVIVSNCRMTLGMQMQACVNESSAIAIARLHTLLPEFKECDDRASRIYDHHAHPSTGF